MSRDSQKKQPEVLEKLTHELRQSYELGASFFRAAAGRYEMTETDMQVIGILESAGEASAGQLAELLGLTTGTFTGILNRLEKAGLVHRERDPNDGRRVIVRLVTDSGDGREIAPLFSSLSHAWEELASHCDGEQMTFLLEFLQQSNTIARQEIARLREAPSGKEEIFSAPLQGFSRGKLVFANGISRLFLRADEAIAALYLARFEGPVPKVSTKEGVVTIRYPPFQGVVDWRERTSVIALSVAVPWQIVVQGGAAEISAELGGLDLASVEVKGGCRSIHLALPIPGIRIPIQISGGAAEVTVRRPPGVAARIHLKGWVSTLTFDERSFNEVGNDVRLQSPGADLAAPCYDIEVVGSVSQVTITSG